MLLLCVAMYPLHTYNVLSMCGYVSPAYLQIGFNVWLCIPCIPTMWLQCVAINHCIPTIWFLCFAMLPLHTYNVTFLCGYVSLAHLQCRFNVWLCIPCTPTVWLRCVAMYHLHTLNMASMFGYACVFSCLFCKSDVLFFVFS